MVIIPKKHSFFGTFRCRLALTLLHICSYVDMSPEIECYKQAEFFYYCAYMFQKWTLSHIRIAFYFRFTILELNLHDVFLPTKKNSCVSDQLIYLCLPLLCRGCSSNSVLYRKPYFYSPQCVSCPRTGSYFDLIFHCDIRPLIFSWCAFPFLW